MTDFKITITELEDYEYKFSFTYGDEHQEHKCILTAKDQNAVIATLEQLLTLIGEKHDGIQT